MSRDNVIYDISKISLEERRTVEELSLIIDHYQIINEYLIIEFRNKKRMKIKYDLNNEGFKILEGVEEISNNEYNNEYLSKDRLIYHIINIGNI
jgi:hypothetical protein